jgi:hypothetical protein
MTGGSYTFHLILPYDCSGADDSTHPERCRSASQELAIYVAIHILQSQPYLIRTGEDEKPKTLALPGI